MKKILVVSLMLLVASATMAQAFKNGRWSVQGEIGLNSLDADLKLTMGERFVQSLTSPSIQGSVEYSLNHIWGIGFAMGYHITHQKDVNEKFSTSIFHEYPYITADLLSLIRGYKDEHWSFWTTVGFGLAGFMEVDYQNSNPALNSTLDEAASVVFPFGFGLEYKLTKDHSIGIKANYITHNSDKVETMIRSGMNDYLGNAMISYRRTFNNPENKHARNDIDFIASQVEGCCNEIAKLREELEKTQDRVEALEGKTDNLDGRVTKLENYLAVGGPDADGDGVPDVRDKEPNTPANSPVDFWGRKTALAGTTVSETPSVYFDFDQSVLDKAALVAVQKVAAKLTANAKLVVEVRGYADNVGKAAYNQLLSQKRADRIKNELIKVYGISEDRIIANGKGKINKPNYQYAVNRRYDFYFKKKKKKLIKYLKR